MARALIVIDIQNDYFPGGALPLWHAEETEARIVAAIGKARAHGDRVILVRHVSDATTGLFADGAPGTAIRPAILDAAGDVPIVTKRYADAFQETDLADHLGQIQDLVICGMMTQNCVVFTALSRLADGFQVQVIGELCAAPLEVIHKIALHALSSKTHVLTAEAVWKG